MEVLDNFFHSFRFASFFVFLGAASIFLIFLYFVLRKRKSESHSHLEFLREERILGKIFQRSFYVLPFLLLFSVLAAIAGPEVVKEVQEPLESRDIALVLDTSGSMMVGFDPEDDLPEFEKTRLGVAEKILREFIKIRRGDRMAFVLYDNPRGYIARGFTDDQSQLLSVFNAKEIRGVYQEADANSLPFAVHRGTNTVEGLKLAQGFFEKASQSKDKLIILITDLDDNPDEIIKVIRSMAESGIKTYIIGIVAGWQRTFSEERIKNAMEGTGARIFYAEDQEDLFSAFRTIDRMEKSVVEINKVVSLNSISWIFIISAIFLALIFIVITEKFKKIP
ncbi:MAG: VWA domain-containing protein [Candidatus Nealsonbacteria bacterium]|nr:VWA domain-containing protein [Candidatus Nealsonbacteria bacterium]